MRWKGAFAALCVAALASAGAWYAVRMKRAPEPVKAAAPAPPKEISLPGTVEAAQTTLVAAPVGGTIQVFMADVGQEVAQGQILGLIRNPGLATAEETAANDAERAQTRLNTAESTLISARLEASRAEADSARAKSEFERQQRLYDRQVLLYKEGATPRLVYEKTERDFQSAKADYESLDTLAKQAQERVTQAEAAIAAAKKLLEDKAKAAENAKAELSSAEIHSPVDGLVLKRKGQTGDEVTRDMKDLFEIATDLSRLRVAADVKPADAARLRPGLPCVVRVAESQEAIPGEIKTVEGGRLLAEFVSPTPAIRPGLSAQLLVRFP